MPRPVCVKCKLFYRPKKNGVRWEEQLPVNLDRTKYPIATEWKPYKVWDSDLWECRGCGTEIIVGHGQTAIMEHFEGGYPGSIELLLSVEDC